MLFDVKTIVSFASCYMTLEPGDVIPTGTVPGVGAGQKPQRFLMAGDTLVETYEYEATRWPIEAPAWQSPVPCARPSSIRP